MGTKQSTASSEVVLTGVNSDVSPSAGRQPIAHPPSSLDPRLDRSTTNTTSRPLPSLPTEEYRPRYSDRSQLYPHNGSHRHHHHHNSSSNRISSNNNNQHRSGTMPANNSYSPRTGVRRSSSSVQSRPLPPLPPPSSGGNRERHGTRRHHQTRDESSRQEWEAFLEELGFPPPPPSSSRPHPSSSSRPNPPRFYGNEGLNTGVGGAIGFDGRSPFTNDPLLLLRELTRRKCPVCSQIVPPSEYERHLSQCMSSSQGPSIQYNEDTLLTDGEECTICLEDMITGDEIARLPCLCVYHIKCIEEWFKVKDVCPQHPDLKLPLS